MPHANRPSGPGKPITERRDSVAEQESLEELAGDNSSAAADEPAAADVRESSRTARHAERAANTKGQNAKAASGTSRDRPRQS